MNAECGRVETQEMNVIQNKTHKLISMHNLIVVAAKQLVASHDSHIMMVAGRMDEVETFHEVS